MTWTIVPFGRHKGKSLPQIILADPDWFYWVLSKLRGRLAVEGRELAARARRIRIPGRNSHRLVVEYHFDDNRFVGLRFVRAGSRVEKHTARLPYVDLSIARRGRSYDKKAGRNMIRVVKKHYFGRRKYLTKERCEMFFNRRKNFSLS
jgi:hypothetical protein